jgi:hypothetical protein
MNLKDRRVGGAAEVEQNETHRALQMRRWRVSLRSTPPYKSKNLAVTGH